jgi:hypothetical protein
MIASHQTRHAPHLSRYFKPQRLHADKAYDRTDLRKWLRGERIGVRIARKGMFSQDFEPPRRLTVRRTQVKTFWVASAEAPSTLHATAGVVRPRLLLASLCCFLSLLP